MLQILSDNYDFLRNICNIICGSTTFGKDANKAKQYSVWGSPPSADRNSASIYQFYFIMVILPGGAHQSISQSLGNNEEIIGPIGIQQ